MLHQVLSTLKDSTGIIEDAVLGDLRAEDIPWIEVSYSSSRSGISNNIDLTLSILVKPEGIPFRPGSSIERWKKNPLWRQQATLNGHVFNTMEAAQTESVVINTFGEMARRFAPNFYEIDPRIGTLASDNPRTGLRGQTRSFPLSALFDPKAQPPSRFIEHWKAARVYTRNGSLSTYPGEDMFLCPFCRGKMLMDYAEDVLWGGGNIGWVHRKCAPWIAPR